MSSLKEVIAFYKAASSAPINSQEGKSFRCMVENVTYRLDQKAATDRMLALRILTRVLRKMRTGVEAIRKREGLSSVAIVESAFVFEDLEYDYVKRQREAPGWFISKEGLPGKVPSRETLTLVLFALPIILGTFFNSKNRANRAMHIQIVAELAGLKNVIQEYGIQRLYDFAPYLIDTNWSYVFLKSTLETYIKLPSPGPLSTHHEILLCDELILSSAYQEEEIPHLPNVQFSTVSKWVPEYAFTYIDRYLSAIEEPHTQTIGYYSHGGWLRRADGHTDDGLNIPEAEEQLLKDLSVFLEANPSFQLKIFPHPKEKKGGLIDNTHSFYEQFFKKEQFTLAGAEERTAMAFEQIDIAVAAFSTILYERLFCGYKTLIGNYGMDHFPMKASPLNNICFNDRSSLSEKLLSNSAVNRDEFFVKHGLTRYRHHSYSYFQNT